MKTYNSITGLIGKTPIVELKNFEEEFSLNSNLFAKLEYFNPAGSVKDRAAYFMLKDALDKKLIDENTTIIEPTSGNTGIGLAALCASFKLKIILTMPTSMSIERRKLLKAYGAQIVLTDASKGMQGAVDKAIELKGQIENSFIPSQFENSNNPKAHYLTTGPEIWEDMDGKIDIFVASIGSGGTITGVGEFLKSKNKDIKIVAVEPKSSPLLSQGHFGPHKIQGIGANFVPKILNTKIYDEIITVSNEDAMNTSRQIAKKEGYLVGISSGACLFAALEVAKNNSGKNILAILPDTGERYLSSELFEEQ